MRVWVRPTGSGFAAHAHQVTRAEADVGAARLSRSVAISSPISPSGWGVGDRIHHLGEHGVLPQLIAVESRPFPRGSGVAGAGVSDHLDAPLLGDLAPQGLAHRHARVGEELDRREVVAQVVFVLEPLNSMIAGRWVCR